MLSWVLKESPLWLLFDNNSREAKKISRKSKTCFKHDLFQLLILFKKKVLLFKPWRPLHWEVINLSAISYVIVHINTSHWSYIQTFNFLFTSHNFSCFSLGECQKLGSDIHGEKKVRFGLIKANAMADIDPVRLEFCGLERWPEILSSGVAVPIIDTGSWVRRIMLSLFGWPGAIGSSGKNV